MPWRMLSVDRNGRHEPLEVPWTDRLSADTPKGARAKHLECLLAKRLDGTEHPGIVWDVSYYWHAASVGLAVSERVLAWYEEAVRVFVPGTEAHRAAREGVHDLTLYLTRARASKALQDEYDAACDYWGAERGPRWIRE